MARARYWKGHLKLSLVTAQVSLTPATSTSGKIRFHVLNRETGNRVESVYVDRETRKRVADKNQVRGFPKDDDGEDYVILEDDEIDAVSLESTRTIDIKTFVPRGSIPWIWYDRPHFLQPEDKLGTEAYGVILQSMKEQDVIGIARLVLYGREHAVLLEPSGKGIILWTLRYGEAVREPVAEAEKGTKVEKRALSAIEKTIERKSQQWRPTMVKDPLQKKIRDLIESSQEKKPKRSAKAKSEAPKKHGNVISITDALRRSLAEEKKRA